MKRTPLKRKNKARAKKRHEETFGPQADLCRRLPCCGCLVDGHSEPAHHPSRKAGGDDGDCVPLCPVCHDEQHQHGVVSFQTINEVDLQLVAAALRALVAPMGNGEPLDPRTQEELGRAIVDALSGIGVDPRTGGHAPVRAPRPKVGR